jgi:hypothetical protein
MDTMQIKVLLEKYFEAMTSLEEEQLLFSYFSGDGIAEELEPYRKHFSLLQAGREPLPVNKDFEDRILSLLEVPEEIELPVAGRKIRLLPRIAAAATIALLIGVSVFFVARNERHRERDTFADPQLAYLEAQKTLLYVSRTMNKGIEPLKNVSKINTGTQHLKSLRKLDNSLEMLNMVSFINKSSNLKK